MGKWKASDFEDTNKKTNTSLPKQGKWSASDFDDNSDIAKKPSINDYQASALQQQKEQKLKELNAQPISNSAEQEALTAIKKVEDRPWFMPKSIAIAKEGVKLSPEARIIYATKNSDEQAKSAGAVATNAFIDSATLGLKPALEKSYSKTYGSKGEEFLNQQAEAKTNHPIANTIGTIAGYVAPGAVTEKIAGKVLAPVLGKVGSKVAQKAIMGAATGGGMELAEGVIRGESAEDIAKRTALGTGFGAVGDVALYGLGKGVGSIANKIKAGKSLTKAEIKAAENVPNLIELPKPANKVVMETPKTTSNINQSLDNLYTKIVDKNNPINKFSKVANDKTGMLASNTNNANGTIDYILQNSLVDRQGNKIGKSLKDVAEQIPEGKEKDFWEYMSQRHNIDRAREGKNVISNYTPEMSTEAVKQIESINPTWKAKGDDITGWIDNFMQEWGVKAGTVDNEIYAKLRDTYKSYFPTQREFSQLEKSIPSNIRKQFVDASSPIGKAKGSERDIHNPLSNIMNLVNRTVKTARYNEVGQSLLSSIRNQPEKLRSLAEVISAKDGMFSNVDNVVTVLENGKPVYLQINDKDLLDSLKGLPKIVNNAQAMRKISNVYKSLITQKNPLFAIRNTARDIPTAYVYGSESNPLKFTGDLLKAGKDIATNSENLQRYKALGGGGANFLAGDADKAAKTLLVKPNLLQRVGSSIEIFNNLTETAPRLAEFNRILNKTGDVQRAIAAANDVTVNFARGGNVTKSIDPFVPYLNAGVQGLDKFFRQFKDKPLQTLAKGGVAITIPEVGLYLINKDNPDYQALDNRTKDTYFLIPKDDGTFTKIPKSRELGVLFGSLFQRLARASKGDKEAFKGYGNTVATNFSPTNPVENNIFSPLIYNIPTNKDFAGRAIVPLGMQMDQRSKYLQYDEKTTEIAKAIGKFAADSTGGEGLSPKQIDYIIKSYTGVIGQIGIPAATLNGDPSKVISSQFTADPIYSNQIIQDFYDNYKNVQQKSTDKNILDNIPSKIITPEEKIKGKFRKSVDEISELNKQIRDAISDDTKIRELRKQIIDIAKEANDMVK